MLAKIVRGQLYLGTWQLSQIVGFEHRRLTRLIESIKDVLPGLITDKCVTGSAGPRPKEYLLHDDNLRLVVSMMPGTRFNLWVKKVALEQECLIQFLNENESNMKRKE